MPHSNTLTNTLLFLKPTHHTITDILTRYTDGEMLADIGRAYQICEPTVSNILQLALGFRMGRSQSINRGHGIILPFGVAIVNSGRKKNQMFRVKDNGAYVFASPLRRGCLAYLLSTYGPSAYITRPDVVRFLHATWQSRKARVMRLLYRPAERAREQEITRHRFLLDVLREVHGYKKPHEEDALLACG